MTDPLAGQRKDREHLEGKKLAPWIKEIRPDWRAETGENFERALYRWEHEEAHPNYYDIEHYLLDLNIYEYEIPDDFWVGPKTKRSKRRRLAEELFEEGYHLAEVRARFEELDIWVGKRSLAKWYKEWKK